MSSYSIGSLEQYFKVYRKSINPHYSSLTKMSLIDQVFMPCRFSFDYFLSHELFWPCYSVIRRDISVFIAQKMVFFTSKHNSPFNL